MGTMDVRRIEGAEVDETTTEREQPRERALPAQQPHLQDQVHRHQDGRVREWWHRDHPTFTAISGFFSGLAYVAVVPALFAAVLEGVFGERALREAFPFVVLLLLLPCLLLLSSRSRRFGKYMLIGMTVTALVVIGVAWSVAWLMVRQGS